MRKTLAALVAALALPLAAMAQTPEPAPVEVVILGTYHFGDDQLGAVLNGRWFTRNAETFARLMQVAEPGDRIVVVFGAGHAAWLRDMVASTPGYRLVEPDDYLPH